jgi:hypothetical protein
MIAIVVQYSSLYSCTRNNSAIFQSHHSPLQ